jgi:hypothetical protein
VNSGSEFIGASGKEYLFINLHSQFSVLILSLYNVSQVLDKEALRIRAINN